MLISIYSLIGVLYSQGKYDEAKEISRRTLRLEEKILGKEHPSILTSINLLVVVLSS
jgi:hypothetical protein